ncbi:MAG: hypothetical protein DRJ66_07770 [Thermoprotei archaeon]|nr:MAG: hypothetical protein DRJ66_07770 [Thermoprotei archaeon]
MKAAVYSLLFRSYKLEDFFRIMQEIGYKAVEIRVHEDGVHLSPFASIDEVRVMRKKAEDYGLEICCLSSYARLGRPGDKGRQELKKAISVGRLADIAGAKVFRIKITGYKPEIGYEGIRKLFREQAKELIETLKREGVEVIPAVEQHGGGDLAHSTGILKDMLRGFEPEDIGVIFDPGNAVKEGWLPIELQIDMIKEYIKHVHVKNYEWSKERPGEVIASPLSRGIIDWRKVIDELRKIGYKGYLSLEDFRNIPPEDRAKEALEFFKSMGIS